ncbi:MAG: hypothetical protein K5930_11250 [Treponemataceae bacterium]|nr:hypothetical protein [Treponemataceae bacterium]
MIALLISGNIDEYEAIKEALQEKDYSCVHYTSFMKAYDNLEEIAPDIVVISSQDYPRHWKIIALAAKTNPEKNIKTILLVQDGFKGAKEAQALSAYPFTYTDADKINKTLFFELINSIQKREDTMDIRDSVNSVKLNYDEYFDEEDFPAPTVAELLSRAEDEYISTGSKCSFIYMNPSVMSLITGKVVSFIYPEICFRPDRKEGFQSVYIGQILDDCSLKTDIGLSSVKVCVTDITDTITMHIC